MTLHMVEKPTDVNTCSAALARHLLDEAQYPQAAEVIARHPLANNLTSPLDALHFCHVALDGHGVLIAPNLMLIILELETLEGAQ